MDVMRVKRNRFVDRNGQPFIDQEVVVPGVGYFVFGRCHTPTGEAKTNHEGATYFPQFIRIGEVGLHGGTNGRTNPRMHMPRGDVGSLDLDVQPANSKGNEGISNNIFHR